MTRRQRTKRKVNTKQKKGGCGETSAENNPLRPKKEITNDQSSRGDIRNYNSRGTRGLGRLRQTG